MPNSDAEIVRRLITDELARIRTQLEGLSTSYAGLNARVDALSDQMQQQKEALTRQISEQRDDRKAADTKQDDAVAQLRVDLANTSADVNKLNSRLAPLLASVSTISAIGGLLGAWLLDRFWGK